MRAKIGIWIMLGMLLLWPSAAVRATQPAEHVEEEALSGYCLGNDLYAFVRLKDSYDISKFTVKLQIGEEITDREGTIEQIRDTSATVRYVFMVDLSGTMKSYAKEINAFLDSLTDREQLKAVYTVATFGEQFQVVKENLTDRNAVKTVLEGLEYREKLTDTYTGVESALTYLDSCPVKSGDLIHLVVVTDGEPDLGIADEKERADKEAELARKLEARISDTPEVIVSTLCTKEWKGNAFPALSAGKGKHETIDGEQAAAKAGAGMAEYVDSLYRISFKLSAEPAERFDMKLKFDGTTTEGTWAKFERSLKGVPNLKQFSSEGILGGPDKNQEDRTESETKTGTETESETEPSKNQGDQTGVDEPKDTKPWIYLLPVLGGVLLVTVCAGILAKRRKSARAKRAQGPVRAGAGTRIAMKLEVYSGKYKGRAATFYLTEPLVIGSAPECGLVFENPEVSPQNSRIFMKDQMIYIEDLNSTKGTALGGMRIQGPNRLRSGDVISIGSVEFCFKF